MSAAGAERGAAAAAGPEGATKRATGAAAGADAGMDFAGRLARLRERLRREKADALLVTHLPNVRYLVNFSGSNGCLLVTTDDALFFSDSRYRQQAKEELQGARTRIPAGGRLLKAAAKVIAAGPRRVALEADHCSWGAWAQLLREAGKRARFTPARGWVEELRAIKEPAEVAALRRAIVLASGALAPALAEAGPGMSEVELAGRIEFAMRRAGGEGASFETLVASGARAALIHGRASDKRIAAGELVILDYGLWRRGYASDMTRTLVFGAADARQKRTYRALLAAQLEALGAIRPGVRCRAVDQTARRALKGSGLDRYFTHSLGHGLGLEVHESPRLARTSKEVLRAGQVVTVEPGVYFPGWGGMRIEDVALVTETGAEVLTPTPKASLAAAELL